jgi:hypothetical protein
MKHHKNNEIFLVDGKQLNLSIWAIEQMMDLFQENENMLIKLGRLRESLINKVTYTKLLDVMGIPQAPSADDMSWTEFLDKLGISPAEKYDEGNK